jgi:hypothetical protein
MFLCGPCRVVILKTIGRPRQLSVDSSVWQFVKGGLEPEADEEPVLERYQEPSSNSLGTTLLCVPVVTRTT